MPQRTDYERFDLRRDLRFIRSRVARMARQRNIVPIRQLRNTRNLLRFAGLLIDYCRTDLDITDFEELSREISLCDAENIPVKHPPVCLKASVTAIAEFLDSDEHQPPDKLDHSERDFVAERVCFPLVATAADFTAGFSGLHSARSAITDFMNALDPRRHQPHL